MVSIIFDEFGFLLPMFRQGIITEGKGSVLEISSLS
jgi:hypothetical protein